MYISRYKKIIISLILCLTLSVPFAVSSSANPVAGFIAKELASNIAYDLGKSAIKSAADDIETTDLYKNVHEKFINSLYENCPTFAKYVDGVSEKDLIKLNEEGLSALKVPAEVALSAYDYWDSTFDMSNLPKDSKLGYIDGAKYFPNGQMAYPLSKFSASGFDVSLTVTSMDFDGNSIRDANVSYSYLYNQGLHNNNSDAITSAVYFNDTYLFVSSGYKQPDSDEGIDTVYCLIWDDLDKYNGGVTVFSALDRDSRDHVLYSSKYINPSNGKYSTSIGSSLFSFPIVLMSASTDELPLSFDYDRFKSRGSALRTAASNNEDIYYYIYPDGEIPDITNPDDVIVPMSVIDDVTKTPEPATPTPATSAPTTFAPTTSAPIVSDDDTSDWSILDFLKWLFDFFKNLGSFLLGLFTIPDGYIMFKLHDISNLFAVKFGIHFMSFGIEDTVLVSPFSFFHNILGLSPRRPDNITADLYGQTLTIINFDYLEEHIDTIHWLIRVLVYPFLLFFIYNNIMMLLRGLKITSSGGMNGGSKDEK